MNHDLNSEGNVTGVAKGCQIGARSSQYFDVSEGPASQSGLLETSRRPVESDNPFKVPCEQWQTSAHTASEVGHGQPWRYQFQQRLGDDVMTISGKSIEYLIIPIRRNRLPVTAVHAEVR